MKKTKNYAMPYPEQDDYFNVEDFQNMMVSVDNLMKKLSDSGAQISSDAEHLYNQTKAQMDNIQKRMNTFTSLKDGSTTGDAELTDIRVAYDGKEYGNAGEAVREQASDMHKALFGAGASIWSKAKSESTKYVVETKGICILNERFTAAGVVTKISRGTFAENESTLNLDRECSAYIVEFEKNPGTVYMPSAETIKIVSTTKIIFEANGNARCWIPVEKGQYLAVDSTATAYTSESNHVPYMLYDQANKTLECRGFGSTGSIEPVAPYSLALEYKLEYDMDDTGLVKQIDANREAAVSLKEDLDDIFSKVGHLSYGENLFVASKIQKGKFIAVGSGNVGSTASISSSSKYAYLSIPIDGEETYSIASVIVDVSYAKTVLIAPVDSAQKLTMDMTEYVDKDVDTRNSPIIITTPQTTKTLYVVAYSDSGWDVFPSDLNISVNKIIDVEGSIPKAVEQNQKDIKEIKNVLGDNEVCTVKKDMLKTASDLLTPTRSNVPTLPVFVPCNDGLLSYNKKVLSETNGFLVMTTPNKLGYTIEFCFSGTNLEIKLKGTSTRLYVVVDNVIVTDKIYYSDTYSAVYAKFLFSSGNKNIKIIVNGDFGGLYVENKADVQKIEEQNKPLVVFDGDSITESVAIITSGTGAVYGYPFRIGQKFNWDILDCACGGSGYEKTGNSGQPNMVDRFSTYIAPYMPDVFIACGGLNDTLSDTLEASIDTYWENAVNTLSTSNIIVCSPFSPLTAESETLNTIAGYCQKAALKHHLPYIDLIHGKTYDAMGNVISQNANGIITSDNHDDYIGDGTHLTISGHEYMANRVSMEIWKILYHKNGLLY